MNSVFHFRSFKIDSFHFYVAPELGLLQFFGTINPEQWEFNFLVRQPTYFRNEKKYVGAINCVIGLYADGEENHTKENAKVYLEAGIAGVFEVDCGQLEPAIEKKLVTVKIPELLLPYMRGTVSSFMANAGFGSFIFPLQNLLSTEAAKSELEKLEVIVIE